MWSDDVLSITPDYYDRDIDRRRFNVEYGWIKEYWPGATLVGERLHSPQPWLILTEHIFMFKAEWHLRGSQWTGPKERSPWSAFT